MEEIETQQKKLYQEYRLDDGVRDILDGHDHTTTFNNSWDALDRASYARVRQFAGGLASVFANSTSVESDISILKWEMDEFRTSMMDLSLEGIFQAKQLEQLADL